MIDRNQLMQMLSPVVQYGLREMSKTSPSHAMFEVSAISYLIGRGYDFMTAKRIVESWEVHEMFPGQTQAQPQTMPHYTYTHSLPQQTMPGQYFYH